MLVVLAVVFASCTTDSEQPANQDDLTLDVAERTAILSQLETTLSAEKGITIKYETYEVFQIDENFYLRAQSGDFVTTTLLQRTPNGKLMGLGVSCTSSSCSNSTTECIPNWSNDIPTCTDCNQGTKDCTRTITSGVQLQQVQ